MSTAWLTEVLRASSAIRDATVVGTRFEQVGAGVGLMGELHRASLTYDRAEAGAPASVVVKIASPFEANRAQGIALGMYEAEVRFYNELADRAAVRVPRVFLAELDASSGEFVIVLEDLGALRTADQLEGMSLERAEAAAYTLADLHARFWASTDGLEWVPSVVHERIKNLAAVWPMLWAAFSERFADWLPDGAIAAGEQISASYWDLMNALWERPTTLLHQDFRCDNLFFAPAGATEEVVVIDWQGVGRGPGAYDLAYLLAGSLTIEHRRTHEERIARAYHERLMGHGVSGYTFDDLWSDYRISQMVNTSVPVLTGGTMDLANERGRQLVGTLGQRHFAAVLDLQCADLIP
jgi:aminoglycoside/choline kinase family phosphotransferase